MAAGPGWLARHAGSERGRAVVRAPGRAELGQHAGVDAALHVRVHGREQAAHPGQGVQAIALEREQRVAVAAAKRLSQPTRRSCVANGFDDPSPVIVVAFEQIVA
jgi:hypothetical protein